MKLLKNDILSKHIPSLTNINIKNKYSIYTKTYGVRTYKNISGKFYEKSSQFPFWVILHSINPRVTWFGVIALSNFARIFYIGDFAIFPNALWRVLFLGPMYRHVFTVHVIHQTRVLAIIP